MPQQTQHTVPDLFEADEIPTPVAGLHVYWSRPTRAGNVRFTERTDTHWLAELERRQNVLSLAMFNKLRDYYGSAKTASVYVLPGLADKPEWVEVRLVMEREHGTLLIACIQRAEGEPVEFHS